MVFRMAKRGLVWTVAGAALLALLFGTAAPSYVKTAWHKVRKGAHDAVPVQFEIDRARQQVAELEPAIHNNIEEIAKAEVEMEHLQAEIATTQANLDKEGKAVVALRKYLETGDVKLTGGASYSPAEIKADMARRFDHYNRVKGILVDKQNTLKMKARALEAAREQNGKMRADKETLLAQIEAIETRLKQIEATQSANEFTFDDSALARAKQTVTELQKRVEVMARVTEQEGRYTGQTLSDIEPGRDIVKEVDSEFTQPAADKPSNGKEL